MQVKPITEGPARAGGHDEVAGGLVWEALEIVLAERIGREQPVVTHMPPGRVARVLGMVENRDADRLALDGAVVITPLRPFAPGLAVAHAGAVDDMALPHLALEPHRLGQSYCHAAFLRVPEGQLAI